MDEGYGVGAIYFFLIFNGYSQLSSLKAISKILNLWKDRVDLSGEKWTFVAGVWKYKVKRLIQGDMKENV